MPLIPPHLLTHLVRIIVAKWSFHQVTKWFKFCRDARHFHSLRLGSNELVLEFLQDVVLFLVLVLVDEGGREKFLRGRGGFATEGAVLGSLLGGGRRGSQSKARRFD